MRRKEDQPRARTHKSSWQLKCAVGCMQCDYTFGTTGKAVAVMFADVGESTGQTFTRTLATSSVVHV